MLKFETSANEDYEKGDFRRVSVLQFIILFTMLLGVDCVCVWGGGLLGALCQSLCPLVCHSLSQPFFLKPFDKMASKEKIR